MANPIERKNENVVFGRVSDTQDRPLPNLVVQALDKDMRSEELLAESITDRDGKYEITWLHSQLSGRDRKEADIFIKVFTREKKALLYVSDIDAVRFNAAPREEINITIEMAIQPEVVEYDYLLNEVSFLAEKVAIVDLQETEENRDITFLSKELEISNEKIEHLAVSHRLQAESKIEAAFFYALLRKNTLLKNDFIKSFHARLAIGINTEILPLLYDAALVDPKAIQRDIEAAVKEMIVAQDVAKQGRKYIEQLQKYRKDAEEYYKNEHPKKEVNLISRFVLEDKVGEIERLFQENKNDLNGFIEKVTAPSFFKSEEKAEETKTVLALGELLGFDEAIISQIKEAQKIKKPEDVKKLAALNKAGWEELLSKSADKMSIAGKPLDKKLINLHASSIVRKMEMEFPTAAFTAQLGREEKALYQNQEAIHGFLVDHEDFDLQHSNIDLFLKEKKLGTKKNDAMREELKSVQRIFKLVPHYSKTHALLQQKIRSSQNIVAVGEARFVKEIAPKAGIAAKEAQDIFRRAERTHTAAMLVAGELQDTIRAMDISAIETKSLSKKLDAVSKDFPNLKSLFKLTDACACEHCRSVYSPAAYLVEILQFLDKRSVVDLTVPAPLPPATRPTVKIAKDVLFERRQELGDIDLSCENANTQVPYIDLVCELLEEAVAAGAGIAYTGVLSDGANPLKGKIANALLTALITAGIPVTDQAQIFETEIAAGSAATLPHYLRDKKAVCKIINTGGNKYQVFRLRQTLSSAEELAAAPDYVNLDAYNTLKAAKYAFKLPFDLDHTEAKAYFTRFDISRAKLMEDFQLLGNPTDEAIAAEKLGLTDAERQLIVTPDAANQQQYWNTTSANASDEMKVVDTFLTKSGLTYKELDRFLSLKFIDPAKKLFIKHLDLSCDIEKKEIANLDDIAMDRMHRFLRLQKKTGWKFETLDEVISQSKLGKEKLDAADDDGNGVTNGDECLIHAATLIKLSEETGIKLDNLIGFYSEIPHQVLNDDAVKPLYHQVFLNKAKNGFIDEGLLPEKVDGSQLLSNYKTSIAVCLQLKEQDLNKLLPLLPDGNLTFSNLSYLFAASSLVKKLKLKVDDFIILAQLTGINIQDAPQATLDFVGEAKLIQKSPLKAAEIQFMLRHEATNLADREIKDNRIIQILEKLQKDYQGNFSANKSLFDKNLSADEQKEALQNVLSKLIGIGEGDVKTFIKFIDKDWVSANAAKSFTDDKLTYIDKTNNIVRDNFDTTLIKNSIDALAAAPGPDISNEQKDLVKTFLDAIADYQLQLGKLNILEQSFASVYKADLELIKVVLKYSRLKQPAPGTELLTDLLMTDTLIDKVNPTPILPIITEPAFQEQFQSLRLLHKLIPLINSFKLENNQTVWFFKNSKALGWFEFDAIPYQSGQAAVDYNKLSSFAEMTDLLKQLSPVPNPADAENPITFLSLAKMLLPGSGATRNQFIETFSLLTGYAKEDVEVIDAHLFPVFNLSNFSDQKVWRAVIACAEHLRKLGSTIAQVKEYIKPELTHSDVSLLRAALKARYDEDTWLGTLKEIMDAIRPQKRNALVAYLLAVNPQMKDENGLYDYFLVDVEMEACMPSSRIVQAHGTVQLFVQRCLMGLEPKAAADVNNDRSWEQWKWMKNYRVWEANRKVFLYPENWIEAELRDDKSFLFSELENELLQNELTTFTAEEGLIKYLEKLDNIAFLEVVATWYQSDIKTMHVFARTKGGDPAIYYYRKFEQERYWTPWEKVELDITGNQLLAFVRNNRLTLAWLVFSEIPDTKQGATLPDQNKATEQAVDKPRKKIKIQLAVSELANKKWQPKKISTDGIETPSIFVIEEALPRRDKYNSMYFEFGQQVWIFSTNFDSGNQLNGVFNIAGCKGYPELAFEGGKDFPDFLPDFKDTQLKSQRYKELNIIPPDDLSVRNAFSLISFYEILGKTPGTFRLSYPHQLTVIDLIALLFQFLQMNVYGKSIQLAKNENRKRLIKLPLGTLLPYFMEDSNQAYVIIPGFYKAEHSESDGPIYVKRTASNVMKLIEDILALFYKYIAKYQANPSQDINILIQELLADDDYQEIVKELKVYKKLSYGEQFNNMYHPLVCALRKTLYKEGIPQLMKRETQLQKTNFDFEKFYSPNINIVPKTYILEEAGMKTLSYPVEDLDFTADGSYSVYNWELFFHVPFLMATRLTKNQRFEEALTWFHYMFNPTGALEGTTPQKYWVTKPFYLTNGNDYINQRIDTLLYKIADPNTAERKELEFAIDQWRTKPFKPHVIARFRPVAYQKALLMKYIDNLAEWGDYLFRQDTMESIVQATQMYILADKLLGPKPRTIPPVIKAPYETYSQMEARLDAFGNTLIDLENILPALPDLSALPEGGDELPPAPFTLSMLYFCIPQNDKMLECWDRIADRLFKIRHCRNIDGVERSLALFAPPIDPGMLVRAAAAGLDISSILAGTNAPTPYYRFNVLSQKATELTQEVRGLGSSLLQALEKKDAEAMSLLRSQLEIKVLNAVKDVKLMQIKESQEQIDQLKKTKIVAEERHKYYSTIQKVIGKEQLNLDKLNQAESWQRAANITYTLGGLLALIPDISLGVSGFGGSPHGAARLGGSLLAHSTDAIGKGLGIFSAIASFEANRASITGGYERRFDDWKLQERLAKKELASIEKQISAAEIRKEIAETDLKNHELQIDNAKKTDDFMRSKFTNKELYDWMIGQISSVYFRAYQLAHDFAKKAERCYRFELGNDDSFISYGYWDSMKKGLQSADHLIHDIKRMETSYLDKNKREYELTKHISLSMLDPLALVRLRATGVCDFDVPEVLYDMDHPGQYFRRIKSVSISLPCIAGPYTTVSAKLSLVGNRYRKNANPDNLATTGYPEDPGNDERFVYNVGAIQSIAASNAQNDSGMFELNFRDERYLPFEGCGSISSWRLELPKEVRQFGYNTISDVILHVKYTAREGGSSLRTLAETSLKDSLAAIRQQLSQTGLHIALNMKHDLPNDWHLFKKNGSVELKIEKSRLPYVAQNIDAAVAIENVMFVAKVKNNPASFAIKIDATLNNLSRIDDWKLCRGINGTIELETGFELAVVPTQLANLEELMLVVKYSFQ
jgi:Tc toxin complex TcA C-terminal TcB-binding domain/Neuraminidase-like domain